MNIYLDIDDIILDTKSPKRDIEELLLYILEHYPDTTYWLKVGLKGEKGQYSLGVVYQGFWNSSLQYSKYDLIS